MIVHFCSKFNCKTPYIPHEQGVYVGARTGTHIDARTHACIFTSPGSSVQPASASDALKEIISLCSKTYVFEDKMAKH